MTIDKELLRELASDPNNGVKEIVAGLGMSDPTFYQHLSHDPDLKQIYDDARAAAREAKGQQPKSAKAKGRKKRATSNTPPRNGGAKASHKDLFNKLRLEFDHIDVYGSTSEHFDELREQVAALA